MRKSDKSPHLSLKTLRSCREVNNPSERWGDKTIIVKQFSPRSSAAVLTLPGLRLFGLAGFSLFSLSPMWRKFISAASIAIGLVAIAIYIAAVNAMLLDGQALNRETKVLAKLEQDYAVLQGLLVQRQSPARLQADALQNGMVAASGVRYINSSQPIAFSR